MHYALRRGISYCCVGPRPVFLDVPADRYFCLSAHAEASFVDLAARKGHLVILNDAVAGLVSRGLLVEAAGPVSLRPCRPLPLPEASVLERALPTSGPLPAIGALRRIVSVRARLKWIGLARTLAAIAARKAHTQDIGTDADARLDRIMAIFSRAARLSTLLDDCLCQSLAVAQAMLGHGLRPDVVLGVRLGPFAAHCWVQHRDMLVNDRFDTVRTFTPILVI